MGSLSWSGDPMRDRWIIHPHPFPKMDPPPKGAGTLGIAQDKTFQIVLKMGTDGDTEAGRGQRPSLRWHRKLSVELRPSLAV